MKALFKRIQAEELAKTKQCGCSGCTNQATHTWSGHPTCNACATPMSGRTKYPDTIFKDKINDQTN